MKRFFVLITTCSLTACAQAPENIAAADIGVNPYKGYSCSKLKAEELKEKHNLENLSAKQKKAQTGDAWGVVLLGLPTSSMSGNDKETEIAVTKGKLQSIETNKAKRNCK